MGKYSQKSDLLQALGLFALVFFGFYFVFISINSKKVDQDAVDILAVDRQVDQAINRSMRGVYNKKQLRDLEITSDKTDLAQKFSSKSKNWAPENSKLETSTELFDEDISTSEVSLSSLSVENQLRTKINQNREIAAQAKREKDEYIRVFKENAKKDGWLVELDDNLNVTSAKEIKKSN